MNTYGPITILTGAHEEPIEIESLKCVLRGADGKDYEFGHYGMGGKYAYTDRDALLEMIAKDLDNQLQQGKPKN